MALTKISGNVVQQNNFSLSGVVTATSFTGDLTGNVTGNVTGTATTATNLADGANITTGTISNDRLPATITKNLTGDVTGNLTGNVTGTATTATNLADGANITTGTISNDRLPATITKNLTGDVNGNLTGNVSSSGANTLGSLSVTNDATVGGALTVTGNLTVNGTTTTIDTVVTAIDSLAVDGDVTAGGNLNITGVSTFGGNVDLGDDDRLRFGAGQDLQIYHDSATNSSYINESGSGRLEIRGSDLYLADEDGTNMLYAANNAGVSLYYGGGKTFETTSIGAKVTGDLNVTGILTVGQSSVTIDGTNNKITTPKLDYAGISSSISDTAVDVFVYDTRKDSDGGAWRKRTQHTSWYNETLNTSTRGSRREFPAVAVIVAESTTLTIYDGDDPDLPMWINYGTMTASTEAPKAVFAKNGIIAWASGYGLYYSNFLNDFSKQLLTGASRYRDLPGVRIESVTEDGLNDLRRIVNNTCNDVAMTVLPNAPIDSATGLPVPTIAVATNGGVSVIKDDGTVVDITSTKAVNDVELVHFDKAGRIYFAAQSSSSITDVYHYSRYTIPSADITNNVYADNSDATYYPRDTSGASFQNERPNFNAQYNDGVNEDITHISSNDDGGIVGNVNGLSIFAEDYSTQGNGMVAYAATSYNTGWMHGDCKGAFLSDTDATNVTGSELVSNYDFTSGTTNWTTSLNGGVGGASVTASSNQLVFTQGTNSVWLEAYQDITTVSGEKYVVDFEIASSNTNANWRIIVAGTTVIGYPTGLGQGHHSYTFTASGSTTRVSIQQGAAAGVSGTAESLSVRIADPDRSVNNNGLQVFGTVTKSAVETGADLVAYSGFSASNYLQQPYNSDLDFGTGDLSIIFWYKTSSGSAQCILHRGDAADSGGGWGSGPIIQIEFNGTNLAAFLSNSGFSGYDTVGIPIATSANGLWNHYALIRSGGTMNVYFNGSLYGSASSTRTLTNTSARTWIGERPNSTRPATNTSLALFRMGASAPSAEQVKKMYEDEKVLFQENAACTLYGSSDAVTALAYDDSTSILYAGTSSGRSDFQGLRRINNTTTAVTTAMSASNGLVAEQ